MKKLRTFYNLLGTRNYYQGIDKPTIWQWLYSWRIGIKTAWKLAKRIHNG